MRWRFVGTGITLLIFVVANLAANLFVHMDQRQLDLASDSYLGLHRLQRCESLGYVPDVFLLGSSRTAYGMDPAVVDAQIQQQFGAHIHSCNAGVFNSSLQQDYYAFKRYLEDGFVPKLVVESVWEYNLNLHAYGNAGTDGRSYVDTAALPHAQIQLLADLQDLPDLAHSMSPDELMDFIGKQTIPIYRDHIGLYRAICQGHHVAACGIDTNGLDAFSQQRYSLANHWGYLPVTTTSIATLSPAERNLYAHGLTYFRQQLNDYQIGGQQPTYLAKLIDLAQAHHVKVALVTTPLHPFYFNYFPRATDWPATITWLQAFAQAHHVAFYDNSRPAGYTDADFIDDVHLDVRGATKYSRWLAGEVVGPLLTS